MNKLTIIFFCLIVHGLNAQTYVDIDATGANDGTSWIDAYTNLNTALDSSSSGDELWVAEGTYIPDRFPRDSTGSPAMNEKDYTFHLMDSVALYGGFNGTETFLTERNIDSFPTILSGEIDASLLLYAYHVILSVEDTASTILDGFSITKGVSFFPTPPPPIMVEGIEIERLNGGGMYNVNSDPTLDSITFFLNVTGLGKGAGMFNDASSPDLKYITFKENHGKEGAGMYNGNGSNPTLLNVKFLQNEGIRGIGVYNDASSPMLILCSFELNELGTFPNDDNNSIDGVGMYNANASAPHLNRVVFRYNNSSNGNGIGMYNEGSDPTLLNVIFEINFGVNGGGIYNVDSAPSLSYVNFSKNFVSVNGGAMYNINSAPIIDNCSFGSNSAELGAAIYNDASSPELDTGEISGNLANQKGGGMYNTNSSSPIINNISFVGNKVFYPYLNLYTKNGGGIYNDASSPSLTNVLFLNNEASNGGGMHNNNSSPNLTNVVFRSNKVINKGGGMNNDSISSPVLTDVTFYNNQTRHNEFSLTYDEEYQEKFNRGGGMHNDNGSSPSLSNVTFENNEANYGGGMSIANGSAPILENVNFSYNEARQGGGIYNEDSSPSISNVAFSNNRARGFTYKKFLNSNIVFDLDYFRHKGGGMYTEGVESITLTNVVFDNNIAEEDSLFRTNNVGPPIGIYLQGRGGGFYNKNLFGTESNITLTNATFNQNLAENTEQLGPPGMDVFNECAFAINLNNSVLLTGFYAGEQIYGTLQEASASGSNNVFGSRFNPAGSIFTNVSFPTGRDLKWGTADDGLRPTFESSIINAGDSIYNSITADIAGQERIIGDTIDIGAYEYTECNDTTEYLLGSWSNGPPTPSTVVIFNDDYDTLDPGNSSILACKCIVEAGKTLTIGEETALHVYFNGLNIEGTIVVEDGGSIINGIFQ